jgi:hypothetical protein
MSTTVAEKPDVSIAEKVDQPKQSVTIHEPEREIVSMTPMAMLDRAIVGGASIEVLEKLMALSERWDAGQARKAFNNALADAKGELPILKKNRLVDFERKDGGRTTYRHEDLAEVVSTVAPILSKFGLSHRYRLRNRPNEPIMVTCIISHRDGHFEENELCAAADISGGKNAIQAVKSTVTYLERITLIASLGLAAGEDDDGKDAGDGGAISKEQELALDTLIKEVSVDKSKFLAHFKLQRLSELPAENFDRAIKTLESKRSPRDEPPAPPTAPPRPTNRHRPDVITTGRQDIAEVVTTDGEVIPDAGLEPEAFKDFVIAKFATAKADELDEIWDTYVETVRSALFPPDEVDLMNAYRRREGELS